jgi:8-oxo-dGTP pyrophosphatase MutT (NUDIX family)
MLVLDINAGVGAGKLQLGANRQAARALMEELGYPLTYEQGTLDYFCENAVQLEYEGDQIRFIGISDHPEVHCTYHAIDVFDLEASELFKAVSQHEPVTPLVKPGKTCFFPYQGINLWEADEQYDRKGGYKRRVYAQIGIEAGEATANA